MANKKISDFTTITDVGGEDLLLIDHGNTTYNTKISSLTSNIGGSFIQKPVTASNGQVLTYSGSTSTWVASAAPTGCARAWVNFDGTRNSSGGVDGNATARFLRSSFNVDSVVRRAENAGLYTVNFTPGTFSSTPVIMSVTASDNDTDSATWLMSNNTDACAAIGINANSCRFEFWSSEQAAGFAPKNATLIVYA